MKCQTLLVSLALTLSPILQAAEPYQLSYGSPEWDLIGNPQEFEEDLVLLQNGAHLTGLIQAIPTLSYPTGNLSFSLEEVAALSFKEGKVQLFLRNGLFFSAPAKGALQLKRGKKMQQIPLKEINTILFLKRGVSTPFPLEKCRTLIFKDQSELPIVLPYKEILLSDGSLDYPLELSRLEEALVENGGLSGSMKDGEGSFSFSFLKEQNFTAYQAKDGRLISTPWQKIAKITRHAKTLHVTTKKYLSKWISQEMCYIPAGSFIPGEQVALSPDWKELPTIAGQKTISRETLSHAVFSGTGDLPAQTVTLSPFYIDKYEVSNEEYLQFVLATNHRFPPHWVDGKIPPGLEKYPVVQVSYKDAEAFAAFANKRLPTEFEWEYAAKGASGQASLNTQPSQSLKSAYSKDSPKPSQEMPFASKLSHMLGNVAEWTSSDFSSTPQAEHFKVVRGGSFANSKSALTTSYRTPLHQDDYNDHTGFRCARDVKRGERQ
ncbi:MAG: hypothetical protein K0S07_1670 [Chlamydiales bacterium]|nr:hypothetical protein [Chlamydiales bacterium]